MFAKATVVAFFALPLLAQVGLAAECARQYTVKEGDICDSISAENKVSTYQLAVVNKDLINPGCNNLTPGQTICLGHVGEDCTSTYVVANGDTCEGVQTKNSINATLLYQNNPQINQDCSNIYIGEVLCVAGGIQAPAPPPSGPAVVPPPTAIPANPDATAVHATTPPAPAPAAPTPPPPAPKPSPPPAVPSPPPADGSDDNLPYCDEL